LRQAYEQADAALIPTLLETFSAAYPEAMRMEKPVLTSALDFATEVCGDAALYFDPVNAADIAARMIQLMQDRDLYEQLVRRGKERLSHMETPASRASKLMHLMQQTVQQKSSRPCVE
jgi:glycosyltransferase involved in cell wall biosynthesis